MAVEDLRPNVEKGLQANYLAPDGYRYGVMFSDGSVADYWNGVTQRDRASEYLERTTRMYAGDRITLARWQPPRGPWTRVLPPVRTQEDDGSDLATTTEAVNDR